MERMHPNCDFRHMVRPYFQAEKQELERQEAVRREVGRQLRARYEIIMREPLPDCLAALVERLADGSK